MFDWLIERFYTYLRYDGFVICKEHYHREFRESLTEDEEFYAHEWFPSSDGKMTAISGKRGGSRNFPIFRRRDRQRTADWRGTMEGHGRRRRRWSTMSWGFLLLLLSRMLINFQLRRLSIIDANTSCSRRDYLLCDFPIWTFRIIRRRKKDYFGRSKVFFVLYVLFSLFSRSRVLRRVKLKEESVDVIDVTSMV